MRLQLLIQRHALPPVTIIHTTGTGPSSHTTCRSATIADLLSDVNDVIPLESSDGEWGLEDYVVEVAATGDQNLTYECLHFQPIELVLREDDEVLVRALSNDDLRVRRLGGRYQITTDGKHLIDGVAFGKRWLRKATRPGVVIPPRKKRRLLIEEEDSTLAVNVGNDVQRILHSEESYPGAMVPFTDDDEDEEDDGDYEEADGAEDKPRQIAVREEFDDADIESEDELGLEDEADAVDLASEVQQVLEDAAVVEQASNLAIANRILHNQLKRKRDTYDDGEQEQEKQSFEARSPGIKISSLSTVGTINVVTDGASESDSVEEDGMDTLLDEKTAQQEAKRTKKIIEDDDAESDDSDVTSSSNTSSSESDADSLMEEISMQQTKKRALNRISNSKASADGDVKSISSSDSGDDNEVSDSTSSSGTDSDSDEISESDFTSSSDSSSDSESESESIESTKQPEISEPVSSTTVQLPSEVQKAIPTKPSIGVPFDGTHRTRLNNNRARRRKRLQDLKTQGVLPENANFQALAEYDAAQVHKQTESEPAHQQEHTAVAKHPGHVAIREDTDIVDQGGEESDDRRAIDMDMKAVKTSSGEHGARMKTSIAMSTPTVPELPKTSQVDSQSIMDPSPKRARRLDLASTNRLVFGSLGLRAPKTAEEGQKLREKLSQNVRQLKQKKEEVASTFSQTSQFTAGLADDESWKNKLTISAVECEEPGGVLPPPPFPFEQGWSKQHKNKQKMRDQSQYYQDKSGQSHERNHKSCAPVVSAPKYDAEPISTSSAEAFAILTRPENSLPTEKELENLPELEKALTLPGATVAYQELQMDASTNYQPEVSAYRLGQVSQMDEDGTVHLQLAKALLGERSKNKIDDETGERILGKFEIAGEEVDEEDDGTREISFSNMIKPRLVKPSSIEAPNSSNLNGASGLRGGDVPPSFIDDDVDVIPESAEQNFTTQMTAESDIPVWNVDTPRKQEINGIIRDAGFESALDEQLLQPIANLASEQIGDVEAAEDTPVQSSGKVTYRFRLRSPRAFLSSSDQRPSSAVEAQLNLDDGGPELEATGASSVPPTSSPYTPTQTTVDYPHISQMDIHSSAHVRTTNSSSHQDAQKLSPAPAVDLSFTVSEHDKPPEEGPADETSDQRADESWTRREESPLISAPPEPSSPATDLTPRQSQYPESIQTPSSPILADDEGSSAPRSSFLGVAGFDGHDSSYHESDIDDNSSLPSLNELTSSKRPSNRRTSSRSVPKKTSTPLPARKSARAVSMKKKKSPTPLGSPELPPSSQPEIKFSQSQREPRVSQVPIQSQVVDLTFSSDPSSPMQALGGEGGSDYSAGKGKTKSGSNGAGRRTRSRKVKQTSQASQEDGIGKKRFLTRPRDKDRESYY